MDSIRLEKRTEGLFVIHEVDEKETLYAISRRYGSSIQLIKQHNEIEDNGIAIGQLLSILVELDAVDTSEVAPVAYGYHTVEKGETLYGIARKYELSITQLKEWNELVDNSIALGQQLKVADSLSTTTKEALVLSADSSSINKVDSVQIEEDNYSTHYVQMGETLNSISELKEISIDSLKEWNELGNDYLRIGQQLKFRNYEEVAISDSLSAETKLNVDGFERIYQEGTASVISDISTRKYLALHPTLPIGTELEVRNLMNNLRVHVKVVGKLPPTGLNKNLMIRLSQPAFDQLGILDPKARVVVSYFK